MDMITSSSNPRLKWVKSLLEKSGERKSSGLCVVEGSKEIKLALDHGFELVHLFSDLKHQTGMNSWPVSQQLISWVHPSLMDKLVLREGTSALLGVFKTRTWSLDEFTAESFIVVVDGLEKPGNIGAIARTVAALGQKALMVTNPVADLFNPHAIRSSVGALFALKSGIFSVQEILALAKQNNYDIFLTHLQGALPPWEIVYPAKSILVLGSEAYGVGEAWAQAPLQRIKIPMATSIDSLNVANTAAMLIYEWVRQKNTR